jgi:hypothetical protein
VSTNTDNTARWRSSRTAPRIEGPVTPERTVGKAFHKANAASKVSTTAAHTGSRQPQPKPTQVANGMPVT